MASKNSHFGGSTFRLGFLLRDAMLVHKIRYDPVCVRLSVRPSAHPSFKPLLYQYAFNIIITHPTPHDVLA